MRVSMLRENATYRGIKIDTLEADVAKLDRELNWFGEHSNMEHLEAVAETLRTKYKKIFELQDDGTLPPVVAALFGALQLYDKLQR